LPADPDLSGLLIEGVLALGGRAVEERDGWIVTHLDVPAGDPADMDALLRNARHSLGTATGVGDLELNAEWREHDEWSEAWKRGLAPRQVTERILVRPSWLTTPPESTGVVIVLDPSMAFGTAEHGTTRGSLRLLDRALSPGDRVLDVGAGSGILGIAAALLGAAEVVAIEEDALACEALVENVERNGVRDRVHCLARRVGAAELAVFGPVSGVVANIEANVLEDLMPGFAGALAPGGWLVLSGILEPEWMRLRGVAERAGFRFVALDADGEWRSAWFERA
jgi:ribosomal protein L11 methyltransferase